MSAARRAMPILVAAVRVSIGLLFVYAAATKLGDMVAFAEEVANYQLLPARLVPLVAASLPGIEIVAGALLLVGVWSRAAAAIVAAMLAVFIGALSQALLRGVDLRCGCFGGAELASWATVARDGAMLVAAGIVMRFGPGAAAIRSARREP